MRRSAFSAKLLPLPPSGTALSLLCQQKTAQFYFFRSVPFRCLSITLGLRYFVERNGDSILKKKQGHFVIHYKADAF